MSFRTVIGRETVDTLVPVCASAVIEPGGPVTKQGNFDRKVASVKSGRPKNPERKRYKRDKTIAGKGRKKVYLTSSPPKLFLLDAMAERREIARSELVRNACRRFAEETPPVKTAPTFFALYCISIPIDELAFIDQQAELRGLSRSEFVRRSVDHYAAHNSFPHGEP